MSTIFTGCFSSHKIDKDLNDSLVDGGNANIENGGMDRNDLNRGYGGSFGTQVVRNIDAGSDGSIQTSIDAAIFQAEPIVPLTADNMCGYPEMLLSERQIDFIMAIETTSGMKDEVVQVQRALSFFPLEQLREMHVDPMLIVLAAQAGNTSSEEHICFDPPVGSGDCPDDSNPPFYYHIDQAIGEDDALNQLAAYQKYERYLRQDALKVFVVISDGDATKAPYDSADAFVEIIEKRPDIFRDWMFTSIHCQQECEHADAVGNVYSELVAETEGYMSDLCLQDFYLSFDELTMHFMGPNRLLCNWLVPPLPSGEYPDPNFINIVNNGPQGSSEFIPMALDYSECENRRAWYYRSKDDPMEISLCPRSCYDFHYRYNADWYFEFGCHLLPF